MGVYQSLKLTETSYDSLANTSQVKVVWKSQQTGESHNDNKKTAKYWITANGVTTAYTVSYTLPAQTTKTILSKTFTIPRADDGTGSVTVKTWMDTGISVGEVELSKTLTLTPIARASTLGAADAFIESTAIVIVNRKSEQYSHSIAFSFGTLSGYLDADGNISDAEVIHTATNIPFKLPAEFYNQIPDAPSGVCTLTCKTYYESQQIGQDQTATFTATAKPALCGPVVSGEVVDVNPNTLALTGSADTLIRYCSTAKCTIAAQARNGAALVSRKINGVETESLLEIPNVEIGSFSFYAEDSRGYSSTVPVAKELLPYIPVTVNAAIARTDPTSGNAKLTAKGLFYAGNFGVAENTLSLTYSVNGGEEVEIPVTLTGTGYTAEATVDGLDYAASHSILIVARDALTNATQTVLVKPGIPVFDWGRDDFSFNVPVYYIGALLEDLFLQKSGDTMSGILSMDGNRIAGLGTPQDDLDAVTKAYADGKISITKLWENANPASTFGAQTISLELSGYDVVLIKTKQTTNSAYVRGFVCFKGETNDLATPYFAGLMRRSAVISDTGIEFTANTKYSGYYDSSSGSTDNARNVPCSVYGIKGVNV